MVDCTPSIFLDALLEPDQLSPFQRLGGFSERLYDYSCGRRVWCTVSGTGGSVAEGQLSDPQPERHIWHATWEQTGQALETYRFLQFSSSKTSSRILPVHSALTTTLSECPNRAESNAAEALLSGW